VDSKQKKCSPSFNSMKLWVISFKTCLNLKIIFDKGRILFVDVFIASCRYLRYCERRTLSFTRIATFLTHPFQLGIALLLLSRCWLYKVILVLHSIYYRYHVLIFLFDLSRYIYFEFPNAITVFKKIGRWTLIPRIF